MSHQVIGNAVEPDVVHPVEDKVHKVVVRPRFVEWGNGV